MSNFGANWLDLTVPQGGLVSLTWPKKKLVHEIGSELINCLEEALLHRKERDIVVDRDQRFNSAKQYTTRYPRTLYSSSSSSRWRVSLTAVFTAILTALKAQKCCAAAGIN